jgi:hypothetical protein
VLLPPCIRQRLFDIAGPRHGVPLRVRAPHRGQDWAKDRCMRQLVGCSGPTRRRWTSQRREPGSQTPSARCTIKRAPPDSAPRHATKLAELNRTDASGQGRGWREHHFGSDNMPSQPYRSQIS